MDSLTSSEANEPTAEECQEQVRRVIQSSSFRTALTLQSLLQFLTDRAIHGLADGLKEYTIGVEALGRKPDYDPKIDPIVRVQSHRLRVKLKEYYQEEGSQDPILIQFPKGHYVPTFAYKSIAPPEATAESSDEEVEPLFETPPPQVVEPAGNEQTSPSRWPLRLGVVILALGLLVLGYVAGSWRVQKRLASGIAAAPRGELVEAFWSSFLGSDKSPVIAYPDAVFLLDDSNDLFRFRHGATDSRGALVDPHVAREFASNPALVSKAGQLYYDNGYTGTGELEAVAMLVSVFERLGVKPTIKTSRDLSPDDLKQHNVILLGSPFQNVAVAQLMTTQDFSFSNPDQHREQWRAQILNAHPQNGEASTYGTQRDAISKVLTADYGLVTVTPSIVPGHWIAIVGGLDTKGTEGAATFITSRDGIEHLNQALTKEGKNNSQPVPFQALVRVRLAKGYQVLGSDLISLHEYSF